MRNRIFPRPALFLVNALLSGCTSVTTKKGVVTLTGKAKNAAEKDLATKLANDVNGVKDVKNRMTIE